MEEIYFTADFVSLTIMKKTSVQSEINESLIEETINLGNQILTELDSSLENTRETEKHIDESIFFHKSAKRKLKGMTWFGYFTNLFIPAPQLENTDYVSFDTIDKTTVGIDRLVSQSKNMNSLLKIQNKELERIETKTEENKKLAKQNINMLFDRF